MSGFSRTIPVPSLSRTDGRRLALAIIVAAALVLAAPYIGQVRAAIREIYTWSRAALAAGAALVIALLVFSCRWVHRSAVHREIV